MDTLRIVFLLGLWIAVIACVIYFLYSCLRKSVDPTRLASRWLLTALLFPTAVMSVLIAGPLGMPILIICCLIMGILWAPSLGELIASPLTKMFDGGTEEVEPKPFYSIAEAKRKQRRFQEAEAEIRKQLDRFPEDFAGWLMLAEMRADDMQDYLGAQEAMEQLLSQEDHAPRNVSFALNRLADWHLKLGQDPEAAKAALQSIIERYPESEYAQQASQRLAHLTSPEGLEQRRTHQPIPMRTFDQNLGLVHNAAPLMVKGQKSPEELADQLVQQLNAHPYDNDAREQLAVIYAEHYRRMDMAAEQLEQLIASPNQQPKHIVHWLNLLADLHNKTSGDAVAARAALQRIVDLYPKSAYSDAALQRMAFLNLETRGKQKSQVVKLGSYEQNIGLKQKE